MRTDWSRLLEYLQDLHVGEQRRISIEELRPDCSYRRIASQCQQDYAMGPSDGKSRRASKGLTEIPMHSCSIRVDWQSKRETSPQGYNLTPLGARHRPL